MIHSRINETKSYNLPKKAKHQPQTFLHRFFLYVKYGFVYSTSEDYAKTVATLLKKRSTVFGVAKA